MCAAPSSCKTHPCIRPLASKAGALVTHRIVAAASGAQSAQALCPTETGRACVTYRKYDQYRCQILIDQIGLQQTDPRSREIAVSSVPGIRWICRLLGHKQMLGWKPVF